MSVSAGLYELRPLNGTSYALGIKSESKNNYALAVLNARSASNNSQKLRLTETGSGTWYITALHSGKALYTSKETPVDGGTVAQYTAANTNWCKWYITEVANTTVDIDGYTCKIVTLAPANGSGLRLDCSDSASSGDGRVATKTAASDSRGQSFQRWALYPSTRYYAQGPVPYDGALSVEIGGETFTVHDTAATVYPTFRVPSSWLSTNTYSWRWSKRDMAPNGTWGAWSEYTAWSTPAVSRDGDRVWIADGLDGAYDWSEAKHRQYYVQVVCTGIYTDGYTYYGPVYGFMLDICKRPTFTLTDPLFSPLGLGLTFGSDYTLGSNRLTLTQVGEWTGSYVLDNLTNRQTILLPMDEFGWFEQGDSVPMTWCEGNDQHPVHTGARNNSGSAPTVSYDGGTLSFTPIVSIDEWGVMTVATGVADSRVWVHSSSLTEFGGDSGFYRGLAPFGDFTLFILAQNGSSWGMWTHEYTGLDIKPSHAIVTRDGLIAAIGLRKETPLTEEHRVSAIYDGSNYDAREYPTYRSAPTRNSVWPVEGSLVDEISNFSIDDIDRLAGEHVIYRRPTGRMCHCFVADVQRLTDHNSSDISISLLEETI